MQMITETKMQTLRSFLRSRVRARPLIHQACLLVVIAVVYFNTPQGNLLFLLPALFLFVSIATAGMYKRLSPRAVTADAVASISITCAVSILLSADLMGPLERGFVNFFILVGIAAIGAQIRFNIVDRQK